MIDAQDSPESHTIARYIARTLGDPEASEWRAYEPLARAFAPLLRSAREVFPVIDQSTFDGEDDRLSAALKDFRP